jgi:hypothetical protein
MRILPPALLPLLLIGPVLTACPPEIGEGKSAGECSDGLDNDDDGAIDCLDAGCMTYGICTGETGDPPDDTEEETDPPADPDVTDDPVATDPDVIINEFMASNSSSLEDVEYPGTYPDWIELINLTDHPIDLAGYMLTDDLTECDKSVLSEGVTIEAGGYLLLWADNDVEEGITHLDFALAAQGEQIGLCNPDYTPLTKLEYGQQVTDWSAARIPDGSDTWDFDESPTPGAPNEL